MIKMLAMKNLLIWCLAELAVRLGSPARLRPNLREPRSANKRAEIGTNHISEKDDIWFAKRVQRGFAGQLTREKLPIAKELPPATADKHADQRRAACAFGVRSFNATTNVAQMMQAVAA